MDGLGQHPLHTTHQAGTPDLEEKRPAECRTLPAATASSSLQRFGGPRLLVAHPAAAISTTVLINNRLGAGVAVARTTWRRSRLEALSLMVEPLWGTVP